VPIYGHLLIGPTTRPSHQHLFRGRLAWALHEIHAPPEGLFHPVCALVLSSVACLQPEVAEARECLVCSLKERLDPLLIHNLCAVYGRALSTKPSQGPPLLRWA
jgi:hypothetical protein